MGSEMCIRDRQQIHVMVKHLLPGANPESEDEADALAIAICHAHHSSSKIEALGIGAHK